MSVGSGSPFSLTSVCSASHTDPSTELRGAAPFPLGGIMVCWDPRMESTGGVIPSEAQGNGPASKGLLDACWP